MTTIQEQKPSCAPVELAVEDVHLRARAPGRQHGRERLRQLFAVPAAHARLRGVVIAPRVVRVVAHMVRVEPASTALALLTLGMPSPLSGVCHDPHMQGWHLKPCATCAEHAKNKSKAKQLAPMSGRAGLATSFPTFLPLLAGKMQDKWHVLQAVRAGSKPSARVHKAVWAVIQRQAQNAHVVGV